MVPGAGEVRSAARLDGLLDRTKMERATFLFPLAGRDLASFTRRRDPAQDEAGSEALKLKVSYLDGAPVSRELPISLSAD